MSYWRVIPYEVSASKKISNDEKILYGEISARLCDVGYCVSSNKVLAQFMGVDERTISRWLANLKDCDFINIIINRAKHRRQIYLRNPMPRPVEPKPAGWSEKQKMFKDAFPERQIDTDDIPEFINMELLIYAIRKSEFLSKCKNLKLSYFIKNYDAIMACGFEKYRKKDSNFTEREYTYEQKLAFEKQLQEDQRRFLAGEIEF